MNVVKAMPTDFVPQTEKFLQIKFCHSKLEFKLAQTWAGLWLALK